MATESELREAAYQICESVGKGSFGEAFLVVHKASKIKYVLKRVRMARQSEWQRNATLQEVKLVSLLRHPFIVPFRESWMHHGHTVHIVYGYCERGDLASAVQKSKSKHLDEDQVWLWLAELLLALDYMHGKKVLHRDLKASNIFLTADGDVQIGDFGLATFRDTGDACSHDQSLVGTPHYMSPELLGQRVYSFKSDIWSLGCVVYELCSQRPAFNAFNLVGLVNKINRGTLAPMPACYSEDLGDIVKAMLRKDPNRRPEISELLALPRMQAALQDARRRGTAIMPDITLTAVPPALPVDSAHIAAVHISEESCPPVPASAEPAGAAAAVADLQTAVEASDPIVKTTSPTVDTAVTAASGTDSTATSLAVDAVAASGAGRSAPSAASNGGTTSNGSTTSPAVKRGERSMAPAAHQPRRRLSAAPARVLVVADETRAATRCRLSAPEVATMSEEGTPSEGAQLARHAHEASPPPAGVSAATASAVAQLSGALATTGVCPAAAESRQTAPAVPCSTPPDPSSVALPTVPEIADDVSQPGASDMRPSTSSSAATAKPARRNSRSVSSPSGSRRRARLSTAHSGDASPSATSAAAVAARRDAMLPATRRSSRPASSPSKPASGAGAAGCATLKRPASAVAGSPKAPARDASARQAPGVGADNTLPKPSAEPVLPTTVQMAGVTDSSATTADVAGETVAPMNASTTLLPGPSVPSAASPLVPLAASPPVPPAGGPPVPPAGGAPVPPAGGAPVPPAGGAPVPPAGGAPIPPAGGPPVPPAGSAPVPPAGAAPVPPAGSAPVPPAGGAPVPPAEASGAELPTSVAPALAAEETPFSADMAPVAPLQAATPPTPATVTAPAPSKAPLQLGGWRLTGLKVAPGSPRVVAPSGQQARRASSARARGESLRPTGASKSVAPPTAAVAAATSAVPEVGAGGRANAKQQLAMVATSKVRGAAPSARLQVAATVSGRPLVRAPGKAANTVATAAALAGAVAAAVAADGDSRNGVAAGGGSSSDGLAAAVELATAADGDARVGPTSGTASAAGVARAGSARGAAIAVGGDFASVTTPLIVSGGAGTAAEGAAATATATPTNGATGSLGDGVGGFMHHMSGAAADAEGQDGRLPPSSPGALYRMTSDSDASYRATSDHGGLYLEPSEGAGSYGPESSVSEGHVAADMDVAPTRHMYANGLYSQQRYTIDTDGSSMASSRRPSEAGTGFAGIGGGGGFDEGGFLWVEQQLHRRTGDSDCGTAATPLCTSVAMKGSALGLRAVAAGLVGEESGAAGNGEVCFGSPIVHSPAHVTKAASLTRHQGAGGPDVLDRSRSSRAVAVAPLLHCLTSADHPEGGAGLLTHPMCLGVKEMDGRSQRDQGLGAAAPAGLPPPAGINGAAKALDARAQAIAAQERLSSLERTLLEAVQLYEQGGWQQLGSVLFSALPAGLAAKRMSLADVPAGYAPEAAAAGKRADGTACPATAVTASPSTIVQQEASAATKLPSVVVAAAVLPSGVQA